MKPALHRSLIFWSGILLMGFICVAWWDSRFYGYSMWSGGFCSFSSYGGASVGFRPDWSSGRAFPPEFSREELRHEMPVIVQEVFPPPILECFDPLAIEREKTELAEIINRDDEILSGIFGVIPKISLRDGIRKGILGSPGSWTLFIPYWLLLLAFALPWSGLLYWRHRRIRRARA